MFHPVSFYDARMVCLILFQGGYGAKDLKGLRVEHSQENFAEGKTVILTLKDKS